MSTGARAVRAAMAVAGCGLIAGCTALRSGIVHHAGPVAEQTWHLYLIVGGVLVFVAGPVLLLVPAFAWHYRLSNTRAAYRPNWDFAWWIEGLIWIPPAAIVIGLGVVLWHYTLRLDPYRPLASGQPALRIQAIGFDWKWLFVYPDQRVAAVNQLAVPVGRPVHVDLTSGTVMQSLMMPRLAGQIYAMAGMRTELNFAVTTPGLYAGENTQFNGTGFQDQKFTVVALGAADYRRWLARVRAAARPLDAAALNALFARSTPRAPIFYSAASPATFARVMARTQAPAK
ncbi:MULTISPECIES: cytochrome ubiquinol oxidase subunit II [unclassified Sphingomonas]|uniref:cytochrome ubiquinol oxidase subunit II n=1 Tax=unclassified Sphingomonas TaxID=196159 RepID=UPI00226A42E4